MGDPNDATQFDPKKLDQFDYLTSQLAAHGTYYGFSHTFQFQVRRPTRTVFWLMMKSCRISRATRMD